MTTENYQNASYNFDNLVKSVIDNTGIKINLDYDFGYENYPITIEQTSTQFLNEDRRSKRFQKFLEMCKKKKNKLKETENTDKKDNSNKDFKEEFKENLPLSLTLIHSVVEKNKNNEKYYKRFMIPLNILMGLKNNRIVEYAYDDIILEKDCHYGLYCPYKSEPLKCPYNHHEMPYKIINNSKAILQGDQIPNLFCLYERPWKFYKNTTNPVRCTNPYCWYNHSVGRAQLMTNNGYYKYNDF